MASSLKATPPNSGVDALNCCCGRACDCGRCAARALRLLLTARAARTLCAGLPATIASAFPTAAEPILSSESSAPRRLRILFATRPGETTVADVATRCGFFHRGRFSKNYSALYGEPPSATLLT